MKDVAEVVLLRLTGVGYPSSNHYFILTRPSSRFPSEDDKLHRLCVAPVASVHRAHTVQLPQMS